MCENIIYGTNKGLRYFNFDEVTYDNVKEVFGEKAASRYLEYQKKGYLGYMGYTSSDEGTLTSFFTTDSVEIDNNDIYCLLYTSPKGPLGRQMYTKLFVYAGPDHKHSAQKPETLEF